jgi:hypothetical protein
MNFHTGVIYWDTPVFLPGNKHTLAFWGNEFTKRTEADDGALLTNVAYPTVHWPSEQEALTLLAVQVYGAAPDGFDAYFYFVVGDQPNSEDIPLRHAMDRNLGLLRPLMIPSRQHRRWHIDFVSLTEPSHPFQLRIVVSGLKKSHSR